MKLLKMWQALRSLDETCTRKSMRKKMEGRLEDGNSFCLYKTRKGRRAVKKITSTWSWVMKS
jgi:hypothetical protein